MNLRRGAQHVLVVIAGVAAVGLAGVPGIVSRSASTLRGMEEPVQSQTASPPTGEVAGSGTRVATNESQLAVVPPRFTLPDGFVIEQVAGPPLVRYPLFGCFDDAGHLYVAEGTGQSVPGPELLQQPLGRIVRLEDTDNDGKFDKSTLFADGLVFRDTLMTAHYMTHKLVRSTLVSDGSTFRAEDVDFLVSSDPHLRLTDVLEDADGSLLAIDMGAWFTYGFLGNVLPRPDMLGAIYRIRRSAAPPGADPRGMALRLTERSVAALIALLDDPRPAVRDRAVDRLAKLAADSVAALETVLRSGERSVEARCNAVWTLCRIDGPEARGVIRQELVPLGGDGR